MAAPSRPPPTLRLVPGEVQARNATTRMVMPTSTQPAWAPFERVGEVLVTTAREFPSHAHQRQEVLTYMVEGFAIYEREEESPQRLLPGAIRLLTSHGKSTHRIKPERGGPIRWFSVVVGLPKGAEDEVRLQIGRSTPEGVPGEGAIVRPLVGPRAKISSARGLESTDVEFMESGTTFQKVGHDRRGVVYALSGRGMIDSQALDVGEGVLVENAAGIAIQGLPGFRVVLSTMPRPE